MQYDFKNDSLSRIIHASMFLQADAIHARTTNWGKMVGCSVYLYVHTGYFPYLQHSASTFVYHFFTDKRWKFGEMQLIENKST